MGHEGGRACVRVRKRAPRDSQQGVKEFHQKCASRKHTRKWEFITGGGLTTGQLLHTRTNVLGGVGLPRQRREAPDHEQARLLDAQRHAVARRGLKLVLRHGGSLQQRRFQPLGAFAFPKPTTTEEYGGGVARKGFAKKKGKTQREHYPPLDDDFDLLLVRRPLFVVVFVAHFGRKLCLWRQSTAKKRR